MNEMISGAAAGAAVAFLMGHRAKPAPAWHGAIDPWMLRDELVRNAASLGIDYGPGIPDVRIYLTKEDGSDLPTPRVRMDMVREVGDSISEPIVWSWIIEQFLVSMCKQYAKAHGLDDAMIKARIMVRCQYEGPDSLTHVANLPIEMTGLLSEYAKTGHFQDAWYAQAPVAVNTTVKHDVGHIEFEVYPHATVMKGVPILQTPPTNVTSLPITGEWGFVLGEAPASGGS